MASRQGGLFIGYRTRTGSCVSPNQFASHISRAVPARRGWSSFWRSYLVNLPGVFFARTQRHESLDGRRLWLGSMTITEAELVEIWVAVLTTLAAHGTHTRNGAPWRWPRNQLHVGPIRVS
jgi:hypothetical protein